MICFLTQQKTSILFCCFRNIVLLWIKINHLKNKVMRSFNIPLHLSLANSLYTQTALNGGVSINADFQQPKTGYLVSIRDGLVFDNISSVNVHELSEWIKQDLTNTKHYFGGWIDQQTKKVYFDLSANVQDKKQAIELSKMNDQLAIWDLNENKEIRTK